MDQILIYYFKAPRITEAHIRNYDEYKTLANILQSKWDEMNKTGQISDEFSIIHYVCITPQFTQSNRSMGY